MSGTKKSPSKRRGKKIKQPDESQDRLLCSSTMESGDQATSGGRSKTECSSAEPSWRLPPHHPQSQAELLAPIPMAHSHSTPQDHRFASQNDSDEGGCYAYGCYQFAPSLLAQHSAHISQPLAQTSSYGLPSHAQGQQIHVQDQQGENEFTPMPLQRTLSTPEPYRPLLHRAGSAFGRFGSFARGRGSSNWGARGYACRDWRGPIGAAGGAEGAAGDEHLLLHQHSDPGISAFHPVWSKVSVETDSTAIESEPASSFETGSGILSSVGVSTAEEAALGEKEEGKKPSPPRLGSKLLSGIKGALKSRRRMSGRENPVSLLAEEEGEDDAEVVEEEILDKQVGLTDSVEVMDRQNRTTSVDMYSDSDLEDEIPIVGQYHLLDEEQSPCLPSVELPSVEVIAEELAGASLIGHVVEEPRPPSVELTPPMKVQHCDDIPETESPAYHPLVDEHDDDGEACHDISMTTIEGFPIQVSYKSPSKSISSPESHSIRGSNTNHTVHTDSSQADYEVRAVNRQGSLSQLNRLNREEVIVDLDGNATVHSSSTSSSNYHVHSPKMREGACMPVDRFFAGGNVVLTPRGTSAPLSTGSEGGDLPEMNISSFLSLSPKKSRSRDAGAHSPYTVSSASVSNTSSSGSETKKPLKFVAYEERMESPTNSTSAPVAKRTIGALIKPRISKGAGQRPPIQHFTSYQKPPQSPRKDSIRGSGTRTPTRTPPPAKDYGSGATTPCSPPVIVDGPRYREGTTRPHVVRSMGGGPVVPAGYMCLQHPSSEYFFQEHSKDVSALRENVTVLVGEGANNGAQEVSADSFEESAVSAATLLSATFVTPEKQTKQSSLKRNEQHCKKLQNVAVVSPNKQG